MCIDHDILAAFSDELQKLANIAQIHPAAHMAESLGKARGLLWDRAASLPMGHPERSTLFRETGKLRTRELAARAKIPAEPAMLGKNGGVLAARVSRVPGVSKLMPNVKGLRRPRMFSPRLGAKKSGVGNSSVHPFSGNKTGSVDPVALTAGAATLLGAGVTARATKAAVRNRYAEPLGRAGPGRAIKDLHASINSPE